MVERLAYERYARGLSTRDIEAAFTDEAGQCLLSSSGVSEVTEALWTEYHAFQQRNLSDIPLLYLLLDGLYEPLRTHGIEREAVLWVWGLTLKGKKVLLALALGNQESYDAWLIFLRGLVERDQVWPHTLRLRCWVHRMRNFHSKVPSSRWTEIKAHLGAIREAPTESVGKRSPRISCVSWVRS